MREDCGEDVLEASWALQETQQVSEVSEMLPSQPGLLVGATSALHTAQEALLFIILFCWSRPGLVNSDCLGRRLVRAMTVTCVPRQARPIVEAIIQTMHPRPIWFQKPKYLTSSYMFAERGLGSSSEPGSK